MKTKHEYTDGPWKAVHSGFGDARVDAAEVKDCAAPFTPTIVNRTSWANARLIASAPDLLAAIQDALGTLSSAEMKFAHPDMGGKNYASGRDELRELSRRLRKALARCQTA